MNSFETEVLKDLFSTHNFAPLKELNNNSSEMSAKAIKSTDKVHYLASTTFTIDKKYSDLKAIGKGSYGVVCSALDSTTGRRIAIKKITPMAKHIMDAKHVLREIRLMRHMGKHENIITLEDLIVREAADELYIVMELLDTDLHR